jgi:hypothetical protein
MKKIILLLFVSIIVSNNIRGQVLNNEGVFKNNSISIEFYKPIQTPMREFFNEDWILGYLSNRTTNFSRRQSSFAVGLCYERITKKNVVIRPRIGVSFRKIHEKSTSKILDNNFEETLTEDFVYDQKHLNIFLGIAKRIAIGKRVTVDLGLDLATIGYSEGKSSYNYLLNQYYNSTGDNNSLVISVNSKIGKAYSYGIGPYLKPTIVIYKNITASVELQMFYLRTVINDNSTKSEIADRYTNGSHVEHIELYDDIYYDIRQWNWSQISTLVRVGYQF